MAATNSSTSHSRLMCRLQIREHLGLIWRDWTSLNVSRQADGQTILSGSVADAAALYAVLRRIRDQGVSLVSISCYQVTDVDDSNESEEKR